MKPITVLLADDHSLVREAMRLLLDTTSDIQVVAEAGNGLDAVREAKRLQPSVAVLDLAMPLLNGYEAARQIAKLVPATRVLIVSAQSDERQIERALQYGASAFLIKEDSGDDLLHAIREVAKGSTFLSPLMAKKLWRFRQAKSLRGVANTPQREELTGRQTQVLQLIAEGYATKQIAGMLSLSIKTVEKHRQELMDRLNLHCVATLTRYAVCTGVVEANRFLPEPAELASLTAPC